MDLLLSPVALGGLAAGVGVSLGGPLLWSDAHTERARRLFGLFLVVASATALCIALKNGALAAQRPMVEAIERVLTLLAGPLLLAFVRAALGDPAVPLSVAGLLPAMAGAAAQSLGFRLPIECVLLHQAAFTVLAVRAFVLGRRRGAAGAWVGWVRVLLVLMALIHISQAARLALRSDPAARGLVAGALALGLLALAAVGFANALPARRPSGAAVPDATGPGIRYRRARMRADTAGALLGRLADSMERLQRYRDPDLSASRLAGELGISPHQLSQLLNVHRSESFNEYLTRLRVDRVKELLSDPSQDRYTIEALGEDAGFRSRSALYAAFSKHVGATPTEYRERVRRS